MKQGKPWGIMAGVLAISGMLMAGGQWIRGRTPGPIHPLVIDGEVTIIIGGNGSPVISPHFNIRRNANPVSNLKVSLNGQQLDETMPGQYAGIRITSLSPRPGLGLTFTIEFPKKPLAAIPHEKAARIEGRATVASMAGITFPLRKSILDPKTLGKSLSITWNGGLAPFQASLLKTTGGSPIELFSRGGIPGHTCAVSSSLLALNNTYSAAVSYKMDEFALRIRGDLDGIRVSKTSKVILRYTVLSDFAVRLTR